MERNFNSVHISTSIEATLVKSNSTKVEFTMKKGVAKNLITEVKNGRLYVKTKSNKNGWGGNNTSAEVTVYYTNLDEVKASAGCTVRSEDVIEASNMEIDVSSGSSVSLEVEAEHVEVDVSSGSTLKLKGSADRGDFDACSGSTLNAYKFVTDKANVEAFKAKALKRNTSGGGGGGRRGGRRRGVVTTKTKIQSKNTKKLSKKELAYRDFVFRASLYFLIHVIAYDHTI